MNSIFDDIDADKSGEIDPADAVAFLTSLSPTSTLRLYTALPSPKSQKRAKAGGSYTLDCNVKYLS